MSEPKPERYVVYWYDWDQAEQIASNRGVLPEDVDPSDFEEIADFEDLDAAKAFAIDHDRGAYIEERVAIRRSLYGPGGWDWEQERVDCEVPEPTKSKGD